MSMAKNNKDAATPTVPRIIGVPAPGREAAGGLIVPGQNSTQNNLISDVVGNKADAPVVVPGSTGSLMGYIKGISTAIQQIYDVAQNTVASVDVDNFGLMEISLVDRDSGLIPAGDITVGTYSIDRIRAGVTTNIVVAGAVSVANGRVFINYQFTNANWQADDAFVVRINGTPPLSVVIDGATYYPPVFPWFGRIDDASTVGTIAPQVIDVIIYPVAEDIGTTVISDTGSNPALRPAVAHTTNSIVFVEAWSEDINFEPNNSVSVISIYAELIWRSAIANVAANSESYIEMSGDGGATWVPVTDTFSNNNTDITLGSSTRARRGVGLWITTVVTGANQLQFRLMHRTTNAAHQSSAQIRSDSYVRITYRKT